jgi:branched-chain amino acid transport system permease protein
MSEPNTTRNSAKLKGFLQQLGPGFWIVVLILALLPVVGAGFLNDYLYHLVILTLMWSMMGMAWNLLGGFTGQVSFGHAAFFGTGAYTGGLLAFQLGVSAWFGLLLGGFVSVVLAVLIGCVCFRLRGPYFALATLALAEILRLVANNCVNFTNGPMGIQVPRTFTSKLPYYYIVLALTAVTFLVIRLLMASKLGYYFVAIREDQDAAEAMGIATARYKRISLFFSAFFMATVGAFYMVYMGYIDPHVVYALHDISIITIMVAVVGGVATFWGPPVGACIMIVVGEIFRAFVGTGHLAFFGILLILIIIFMPNGVVGDFPRILGFIRGLFQKSPRIATEKRL